MGRQAKVKEGQLFPSLFSLVPQNQLLKGWGPTLLPSRGSAGGSSPVGAPLPEGTPPEQVT